jgi:transcriptional regulator with GAF, ATPase, and Fis domain
MVELTLVDPSMSARHARLFRVVGPEGPLYVLNDLGSTNGCFVDGVRITEPIPLNDGAIIETGKTFWRFRLQRVSQPDRLLQLAYQGGEIDFTSSFCLELLDTLSQLTQIAPTDLSVIICGESGTGKEGMAQELHGRSGRGGPLLALNCAAVPEGLIESELFGHRKGAFTGAVSDKSGMIEAAAGGTLLLDEVGDMPLSLQAKLLRVLQERTFTRVGDTSTRRVDVRFVAATHRDLPQMVGEEKFRGDLYARLNGLTVKLPPLRDRKEDICILLSTLLARHKGGASLSHEALRALILYDWPFNIRELDKAIAVAVAFAGADEELKMMHLPGEVREVVRSVPPTDAGVNVSGAGPQVKKRKQRTAPPTEEELVEALKQQGGNVSAVARQLETTRMQVHRWMKRHGIDPDTYRS